MTGKTTKGYKTSEFWLSLSGVFAGFLNQAGILGDVIIPVEPLIALLGGIFGYGAVRSHTKTKGEQR